MMIANSQHTHNNYNTCCLPDYPSMHLSIYREIVRWVAVWLTVNHLHQTWVNRTNKQTNWSEQASRRLTWLLEIFLAAAAADNNAQQRQTLQMKWLAIVSAAVAAAADRLLQSMAIHYFHQHWAIEWEKEREIARSIALSSSGHYTST